MPVALSGGGLLRSAGDGSSVGSAAEITAPDLRRGRLVMRTFFLGQALQGLTALRGCGYLAALAPGDVVGEAMVHVTMPGFVEPHGCHHLAQPRIGRELPIVDRVSGCRHILDLSRVDAGQ